jgi:hypothetical protein
MAMADFTMVENDGDEDEQAEVGFPSAEWRRSIQVKKRNTAGSVLVFCGKLAALEVLRRGAQTRCRFVWWALQGLAISGAPALSWFRRWTPFRVLADASESFAKPMLFLSLTSVVANAYTEARERKSTHKDPTLHLSVVEPTTGEVTEEEVLVHDKLLPSVTLLKQELNKHGVLLCERVDDEEIRRFWLASKGDVVKFVSMMQKTLKWRESHKFMSLSELKDWSPLLFWHLRDSHTRPILIIRLGLTCATITPAQRSLFAQAVLSQVEYGVQNLLSSEDPRLTVVMDCRGTSVFGFPVQMLKSCVALVQEHYPMRLASFFLINAPPLVRVVANAIIQMLRPATREKVRVEGDNYLTTLANAFGGCDSVAAVLGGTCACALCIADSTPKVSVTDSRAVGEPFLEQPATVVSIQQQPHLRSLRVIMVALVCLWILVALINAWS